MLFTGHPTPVSARSFTTHIQRNDIPVVVDFCIVRALQSDGTGFRARRRRVRARASLPEG
jgi:hypothetical protein